MNSLNVGGRGTAGGVNDDEFWQQAVRISEQRLAIIASNIANADTPHYKARDIDFRSALQQALSANGKSVTGAVHGKPQPLASLVMYRTPDQYSADGNTVDMDTERAAFSQQAITHEFLLQKALDEYKEIGALFKNMVG